MRLFTAVDLPEPVLDLLTQFTAPLRSSLRARWSSRANLHITTRFIGEWAEADLPSLLDALSEVDGDSFQLRLSVIGHFPRVLWVGVEHNSSLVQLAARTQEALAALGCPREQRPYTPHVTLAREKDGISLRSLLKLSLPPLPAFPVDAFHLYASEGGVYTKMNSFALVRSSK